MTKSEKFLAALREEIRRELLADSEPQRRIRTLESKLRIAKQQRDAHRARCAELRAHITRYQAEVVALRGTLTALPWSNT